MEKNDKYNVKAVERCFQVLDYAIKAVEPFSIQDICSELDINSNMAFRLLSTMGSSGYLVKDESTSRFSVSLKVLQLSRISLLSLEIRKIAMPYLELLWNQYPKANINLAVYNHGDIVVIDRVDSQSLPRTYFTPGKTLPFHCTGLGKILTCELEESRLEKMVEQKGLKSFTTKTITDVVRLKEELGKVREEQLGRDRNEFILNDNCNAAPIRDRSGRIVAGISISAFESYMTEDEVENTKNTLRETARKISYIMGYNNWQ